MNYLLFSCSLYTLNQHYLILQLSRHFNIIYVFHHSPIMINTTQLWSTTLNQNIIITENCVYVHSLNQIDSTHAINTTIVKILYHSFNYRNLFPNLGFAPLLKISLRSAQLLHMYLNKMIFFEKRLHIVNNTTNTCFIQQKKSDLHIN